MTVPSTVVVVPGAIPMFPEQYIMPLYDIWREELLGRYRHTISKPLFPSIGVEDEKTFLLFQQRPEHR